MLLFVAPEQEPAHSTAPLFTERCPAGFPSPAADYTEEELDLNDYCIRRPASTYFRQGHRGFNERDGPAFRRPDDCRQSRNAAAG